MLNKSLVVLAMLTTFVAASEMEQVLEVGRDNTELSAQSQAKIDSTESATDKLINEFKVVSKQVEGLKLYNAQKRIQIQAQLDLMDKYDEQLIQVVVMQRQIPPLAQRMLQGLEKYVNLDTPFHIEERRQRLDLVRASLSNPKVTASEQVRQILEAYNIEAEYGRKLDAYDATIVLGGQELVVNILRVGRLGMFFQTKDERQTGYYDTETGSWEELGGGYRVTVRDGIRMANKLAPMDIMMLPIVYRGDAS
ncbi:MAG: DUF3450 domain-containing protein [Gammaproteobacteria bacterium]|jgi:hypothetical protein|nr:DUF3450 domain-containing protein [Gammaproteobacteria bacterium]